MPDKVTIESEGLFEHRWDSDLREYVKSPVIDERCLTCLRCHCELAPGLLLKQLMMGVMALPSLTDFLKKYSWCRHIDAFHADVLKMTDHKEEEIEWLEVYAHAEVWDLDDGSDFSLWCDFHGIGYAGKGGVATADDDGRINWSVSCTPMHQLANLPIKLNETIHIWRYGTKVTGINELWSGKHIFTLLEVLDAIYDDISFHGGPEQNAAFMEEMREIGEKIKKGEVETQPLDFDADTGSD